MGKHKTTLFTVECTTCKSRIKVLDLSAIGEIYACPKCEGMVQLIAPPGWTPPIEPTAAETSDTQDVTQAQSTNASSTSQTSNAVSTQNTIPTSSSPASSSQPNSQADFPHSELSMQESGVPKWQIGLMAVCGLVVLSVLGGLGWTISSTTSEKNPPQKDPVVAQKQPSSETKSPTDPVKEVSTENENSTQEKQKPLTLPGANIPETTKPDKTNHPTPKSPINPDSGDPETQIATAEPTASTEPNENQPNAKDPTLTDPTTKDPKPGVPEIAPLPMSTPREVKPLPKVDVASRLAQEIKKIQFTNQPLLEVVELLSSLTNLSITLDVELLSAAGITTETPISLRMEKTNAAALLQHIVDEHQLGYIIQDSQILITTQAKQHNSLETASYHVSDLITPKFSKENLVQFIQQAIQPKSWTKPDCNLEWKENELQVSQHHAAQIQVGELLQKLRLARRLPLNNVLGQGFQLTPRLIQVEEKLITPLLANFPEKPLGSILNYLESRAKVEILIDSIGIGKEGLTPDTQVSLRLKNKQPLSEALEQLLSPYNLTYRAIDAETLQVTSRQTMQSRFDLECYPIEDLVSAEQPVDVIVALVKSQIAKGMWNTYENIKREKLSDEKSAAAPNTKDQQSTNSNSVPLGTALVDPVSNYLFVVHQQEVQERVAMLLDNMRAPSADALKAEVKKKPMQ